MITVHHLNNSRSQRVLWLLEELGVPYEIKYYQRGADLRAPAELRAIHPLGKSPVVTDNGNHIIDCRFAIPDPAALNARLSIIPGVVETGLFCGIASRVIAGSRADG